MGHVVCTGGMCGSRPCHGKRAYVRYARYHPFLPCTLHPTPLLPCTLHPTPLLPYTLHPTPLLPYTLQTTPLLPCTLHPAPLSPYTLHPTPCSLQPAACSLQHPPHTLYPQHLGEREGRVYDDGVLAVRRVCHVEPQQLLVHLV